MKISGWWIFCFFLYDIDCVICKLTTLALLHSINQSISSEDQSSQVRVSVLSVCHRTSLLFSCMMIIHF